MHSTKGFILGTIVSTTSTRFICHENLAAKSG